MVRPDHQLRPCKQIVRPTIEKAVQDLLAPVVERSIKIALTTVENIYNVRNNTKYVVVRTCVQSSIINFGIYILAVEVFYNNLPRWVWPSSIEAFKGLQPL